MSINSTTNTRQNSIGLARQSISGSSRQSSIGGGRPSTSLNGRGKGMSKADTRPVTDKKFKDDAAKVICMYLREHNFSERHIDPKVILNPSAKDFFSVLEFLFQQIFPTFVMGKQPDEDAVNIFKLLKYPFINHQFNKKNLVSPGSPHVWPHLLAALKWLVELLRVSAILLFCVLLF